MMTLVTHVHLKEGAAREWDATMRTRLSAAKKRPGWVGAQLLRQADKPDRRVIVGTIPAVPLAAGRSGDRVTARGAHSRAPRPPATPSAHGRPGAGPVTGDPDRREYPRSRSGGHRADDRGGPFRDGTTPAPPGPGTGPPCRDVGRLTEMGAPDDLLAEQGHYARVVGGQLVL